MSLPRRILIIGGGPAGLALALALKRVGRSTGLNLVPIVFESKWAHSAYSEHDQEHPAPHYILWRWAVEILVEMGLGGRLSKIAAPILHFKSMELDTQDPIVEWPPSNADRVVNSVDEEIGADSALPPMVATRRCDLVRLLLLALSGARDDLVFGDDYLPTPANNSDLTADPVAGHEGDLAIGEWFHDENFEELVPELVLGETLESYEVDPVTGEVTASFASGRVERGSILVGADGAKSKVREILLKGKHQPTHAGACVFSGVTRLVVPPVDTPDSLENGKPIPDLVREDMHEFCPDGRAVSLVAPGLSFGISNLGNGVVGWNLIVAQTEPGQHTDQFNMAKTRKLVSEAIAKNPRSSILIGPSSPVMTSNMSLSLGSINTDTTNPEDKWGGTSDTGASSPEFRSSIVGSGVSSPLRRSGTRMVDLFAEPEEDDILTPDDDDDGTSSRSSYSNHKASIMATRRPGMSPSPPGSRSLENGNGLANGFYNAGEGTSGSTSSSNTDLPDDATLAARRLRRARAAPSVHSDPSISLKLQQKLEENRRSLQTNSFVAPKSVPNLLAPPEPLNGTELRTLALRLSMGYDLPHPCFAVMARTDPTLTKCNDTCDMSEDPADTWTYQYHRGRVMLIGDAAHLVAVTANGGSVGGGLALTDAAMLAKLIGKHLAMADGDVEGSEDAALKVMAEEFEKDRIATAKEIMKEARADGGWGRSENGWVRSLLRVGRKFTPTQWTRSTYAQMLRRGAVRSGLPSLMPVGF
ncbi:hypothetical protein HK101_001456 [Irineochytrium annulatum]|nr:hypothetical protein HK101_001456 [Irineochytrium annulatum]